MIRSARDRRLDGEDHLGITADQMTAHEFFVGVARLGGHLARKNDGPPGWLTLWRGWSRLHQMIAGAQVLM